jgi:hypothetical protein
MGFQRCKSSRDRIVFEAEEICHGEIPDRNRTPLPYPVLNCGIPDDRAGKGTGFL